MKKLLTIGLLAWTMLLPMQADSYHDALIQYMQTNTGAMEKEQYAAILKPLAEGYSKENSEQLTNALAEYASSQMINDLAEIYEPAFRKHVTEEDLVTLTHIFSDARFRDVQQRMADVVTHLQQFPEFTAFVQRCGEVSMAVIMNKPLPADIDEPAGLTPQYLTEFNTYYRNAQVDKTLMKSFQSVTGLLTETLRKQGVENPEEKANELVQYISRNMPTVMLSVCLNSMTIDDLRAINAVSTTPAYKNVVRATSEVSGDPIGLSINLFGKLTEWVDTHYPQLSAPLRQRVTEMEKVQQMLHVN